MNPATLLYRQVHPSWIREGRVASLVFQPTPKDNGRLSVYDGDGITPGDAWRHYTGTLGLLSDGVVAVTLAECTNLQLSVVADPLPGFPEHTLIDFTGLPGSQVRRVAQRLRSAAGARGWLFHPYPP